MSPCEDIIYNSLDYGTSQSWIMSLCMLVVVVVEFYYITSSSGYLFCEGIVEGLACSL